MNGERSFEQAEVKFGDAGRVCIKISFANSKRTFRMSNKPLIGMNADYRAAARSMPAYSYVAAGYFQSIISAGEFR